MSMLMMNIRDASCSGSLFKPLNVLWKKHDSTPGSDAGLPMAIPKPTLFKVVRMKSDAKLAISLAPTVAEFTTKTTLFAVFHV